MTASLDITTKQRKTLLALLRRFIPGVEVWAYGSRVKWTSHPASDLDLVVFTTPEQHRQFSDLKDALADSNLPFMVGVHVWAEEPERFQEIIRKEYVVLQRAGEKQQRDVSGWQTIRLGSACKKIGSGATPRGGREVYQTSGISLIRSQNIYNDGFKRGGLAFIGDKQAKDLEYANVQTGDVLLNITGDSVARVCQVPDDILPARVNQHVAIIRPKKGILDARFLHYYLIHPQMQAQMLGLAGAGATRNALTKGTIEAFEIKGPSFSEQRAIASVLGALDDKIELNRRTNETLEALAQSLFKSWFVDAAQERLPKGWTTRALFDCADYINGAAFRTEHFSAERTGLPIIKIGELKDGITAATKFCEIERELKYRINSGDILFSWSGSPDTSIDIFIWTEGEGWLNQHIFKMHFKRPVEKLFVYYLLKHLKPVFIEIARNKQTTGLGHVTGQDLKRLKTFFPTDDVLEEFNRMVDPLFQKVYSNLRESRTLAALRNALLPKLLSGELRVPTAAKLGEART
jgi:type I restriction enzyme S subunit